MTEIKNRWTGKVIFEGDCTLKDLVEKNKYNLSGSNLRGSNLRGSDLSGSNLRGSDLSGSDLSGSNLRGSNLRGSDLSGSNLRGSNLSGSNLSGSNLSWSNLSWSNLRGSEIEFWQFPSIRLLSSMELGTLSDDLTTELFRRDMAAHPHPEKFEAWEKGKGPCPYETEERWWFFELRINCWKPGKPKLTDCELIKAICKDKGWKIKGYEL